MGKVVSGFVEILSAYFSPTLASPTLASQTLALRALVVVLLSLVASGSWAGETVTGPSNLPACAEIIDGRLEFTGDYYLSSPREQLFGEVLGLQRPQSLVQPYNSDYLLNGRLIISFLVNHPLLEDLEMEKLYQGSAGVSEGFSLSAHTQMVFNTLRDQYDHMKIHAFNFEFLLEFFFAIAVHDIGKSLAVAEWSAENGGRVPKKFKEFKQASQLQKKHTLPVMLEIMRRLQFSKEQVSFVTALVDNDFVGEVTVGKLEPAEAFESMRAKAEESGLSFEDFFKYKNLFFIVDAASYPGLRYGRGFGSYDDGARNPVFVEDAHGLLVPTSENYHEFLGLVNAELQRSE